MRILLDDGNQICLGTGIGKYSQHLYDSIKALGENIELVQQTQKHNRVWGRIKYLVTINGRKYQKKITQKYDVVIYTNYAIPFRKNRKTKYVATIHDMASFYHPYTLPILYRIYNKWMIINTIKNADKIFTVSNSTKEEINKTFPKATDVVVVYPGLYEGIEPMEAYEMYANKVIKDIDNYPYFLFVGTIEKRKNVGFVIDAFIQLKRMCEKAKDSKLVLAGRPGFGYDSFVKKVEQSEYSGDILFTGYISEQDCNRLYNHAQAFIFPTRYEGFGSTQLECMKCHLPIILSDIPTNREVSRNYGLFFGLDDLESLVQQMSIIVEQKYNFNKKRMLADEYLLEFDWNKASKEYMSELKSMVGY